MFVIGDLHVKDSEPHKKGFVEFSRLILEMPEMKQAEYVIFLGDIYHEALPGGDVEYLVFRELFEKLSDKKAIFILQGNHDYSRRDGCALSPLKVFPNVEILDTPVSFAIKSCTMRCLPFMYPNTMWSSKENRFFKTMKEEYSNPDNFPEKEYDFIFGHYGDETSGKFTEEANTSFLKGKKIFGHIHKRVSSNYLGTPYPTRRDEKKKKNYVGLIDLSSKMYKEIEIDPVLDFHTIKYGDKTDLLFDYVAVVDIKNAPSTDLAREYFASLNKGPDVYLDNIEKEVFSELSDESVEFKKTSAKEYLEKFSDLSKLDSDVKTKMLEVLVTDYI